MFDYENPQTEEAKAEIPAYQQLKAHNNERVFSVKYQEGVLYTTSKDKHVNLYRLNRAEEGLSQVGMFLPSSQQTTKERYYLTKISQQKEEDLNIIYQLAFHSGKCVMLGFYGNDAYIWDKQENM